MTHVAGSYAHTFIEAGRNYMRVKNIPHDRESFIEEIRSAELVTAKCIPLGHKITVLAKLLKLAGGGNFGEIYRLVVRKLKKSL